MPHNTRRMNQLEELGRVDAERAFTGRGRRNLSDERRRIVGELKGGGAVKGNKGMGVALRGGGKAFMKGGKV